MEFHCKYHPTQMKGTITISGSSSDNIGATSTPAAAIGGGYGLLTRHSGTRRVAATCG